jgi:hypothetical protein
VTGFYIYNAYQCSANASGCSNTILCTFMFNKVYQLNFQYTRKCTSHKRRNESFKELRTNVYIVKFVFCIQCCLEETAKIGENLCSGMKPNFFLMFLHIYCGRVTLSRICILPLFTFVVPKRKVTLLLCLYLFRLSVCRVCEKKGKKNTVAEKSNGSKGK